MSVTEGLYETYNAQIVYPDGVIFAVWVEYESIEEQVPIIQKRIIY